MSDRNGYNFVEIVFPIPVERRFIYRLPPHLAHEVMPGSRVLAPFGRRYLTGFVVSLLQETTLKDVKDISDVLDARPSFSPQMLSLTRWMADYYFASWGGVLDAALPTGMNLSSRRQADLVRALSAEEIEVIPDLSPKEKAILRSLRDGGASISQLQKRLGRGALNNSLERLKSRDLIQIHALIRPPSAKPRSAKYISLTPRVDSKEDLEEIVADLDSKLPRQAEIVSVVAAEPKGIFQAELLRRTGGSSSSIKSLINKGILQEEAQEIDRDPAAAYEVLDDRPQLNPDQSAVLADLGQLIAQKSFAPVLLHGVTGSGKTQVYLEALVRVRELGRNAIVLVPEIALTPQTVGRFKGWFGAEIAVLHSRMSEGERFDSWRRIHEGRVNIVIGPRSAILAPLDDVGLIVVDEEHESSYKQQGMSPRYHARDVALVRGKMSQALVILGSATPAIESYHNAKGGKYKLLTLPNRVENLPLPNVEIVDMSQETFQGREAPIFSARLCAKIQEKLDLKEQIILLQNRRGFSTFIMCWDCGYVAKCKNCNITLTYHLHQRLLRCHYCDFARRAPEGCPGCEGSRIGYRGTGTQRVEEQLQQLFPAARVVRMDMDTTSTKGAHHRILGEFRRGEHDILLGTQMVSKGLDFPRVTLVGVISADTTLKLPDFRAPERTFQLLTQVAGRAGRKTKQGEVIIQTFEPLDYSIALAQKHDYMRFYEMETEQRRELNYPPFSRLIAVIFRGREEARVGEQAAAFVKELLPGSHFQLLGPAPSPLSRLKNEYRYRLLLKTNRDKDPNGRHIRATVQQALARFGQKGQGVKITVDVDPVDLF